MRKFLSVNVTASYRYHRRPLLVRADRHAGITPLLPGNHVLPGNHEQREKFLGWYWPGPVAWLAALWFRPPLPAGLSRWQPRDALQISYMSGCYPLMPNVKISPGRQRASSDTASLLRRTPGDVSGAHGRPRVPPGARCAA